MVKFLFHFKALALTISTWNGVFGKDVLNYWYNDHLLNLSINNPSFDANFLKEDDVFARGLLAKNLFHILQHNDHLMNKLLGHCVLIVCWQLYSFLCLAIEVFLDSGLLSIEDQELQFFLSNSKGFDLWLVRLLRGIKRIDFAFELKII